MRFLRLVWRGIRDVFEQFTFMAGLSLGWWICATPVFAGFMLFLSTPLLLPAVILTAFFLPPATVTLFAMSDPRRIVNKPDRHEVFSAFATSIKRGWAIGVVTVPFLIVLGWNIAFFEGSGSFLAAFVPLWAIMFLFISVLTLYMFSLAGTMESPLRNAFRGGMFVLVSRPFTAAILGILIFVIGTVFTVMVLPMLIFGPTLIAAIVNRFVLDALKVEVVDPNAPTNERAFERAKGINPEPTVWDRIKRGGRSGSA